MSWSKQRHSRFYGVLPKADRSGTHSCIWQGGGIHLASKGWAIKKFLYKLFTTHDLVNLHPGAKWMIMGLLYSEAMRWKRMLKLHSEWKGCSHLCKQGLSYLWNCILHDFFAVRQVLHNIPLKTSYDVTDHLGSVSLGWICLIYSLNNYLHSLTELWILLKSIRTNSTESSFKEGEFTPSSVQLHIQWSVCICLLDSCCFLLGIKNINIDLVGINWHAYVILRLHDLC